MNNHNVIFFEAQHREIGSAKSPLPPEDRTIRKQQELIKRLYLCKDSERGPERTFICLIEETGELAKALLNGDRKNIGEEMADTAAWLFSLANVLSVDLENTFAEKYPGSCIKCGCDPCACKLGKMCLPEDPGEEVP